MECIKILLLSLLFSISLSAQTTDSDTTEYREVGIGFSFINSLLPIENNIGGNSTYQIYYNKIRGSAHIRMAFRLSLDGEIENDDSEDAKTVNNVINFSFQYTEGKSKEVYNNFDLIYGWKVSPGFSLNNQRTTSETDPNQDTKRNLWSVTVGTGPFAGLQYHVAYNVSLYLETSYQIFVHFKKESFDTVVDTSDFEIKEFSYMSSFSLPTHLILLYRF